MLRAAWKSLLGRKLRLLLSALSIVLGVAFVAGSLMFTNMLNSSFQQILKSALGDVVVSSSDASSVTRGISGGRHRQSEAWCAFRSGPLRAAGFAAPSAFGLRVSPLPLRVSPGLSPAFPDKDEAILTGAENHSRIGAA